MKPEEIDDLPFTISMLSHAQFHSSPQQATTVHETFGGLKRYFANPLVSDRKNTHGAVSLATFKDGIRRNENVLTVSGLGLDLDDEETPLARFFGLFGNYSRIGYTTFAHEPAAPRSRVIVLYSRPVTGPENRIIFMHATAHLAAHGIAPDAATKDPARLWFVPVVRPGASFEFLSHDGRPIDVDAMLASARADDDEEQRATAARNPKFTMTTPNMDRVRRYLDKMDPAISGSGGSNATFRVACFIAANVDSASEQLALMHEYNERCQPKWSDRELIHKLNDARKRPDLRPLSDRSVA